MFKLLGKSFLFLFISVGVFAQTSRTVWLDSAEVKKVYRPWMTFASLRVEKLYSKGSSLYGEYSYNIPEEYASLNEVSKSFLWLGYEQAFTQRWYGGVSEKINFVEEGAGSLVTRFNFAHRGKIGKLFFYKEVAFEHLYYLQERNYRRKAEGRFSPSLGLGRSFNIADKSFYVGINYRLFLNFDFQQDNSSLYDKRLINRTKLRFDLAYQFLPHWNIGLYYLRDTEYYFTLAQYNQFNQVVVPDYKVNQITQGVGVVLTYLLFKENSDKYIPGLLPSR